MCSGFGYVFGGSDYRIRQEASSQLKFWTAGMGTSMQRSLKPNELQKPALYLPKEHGKSSHSPLSKEKEFRAPGWGPLLSAVVLFDLLIVRLLVIGDVVVILLNLMIWHSNCWDKRSRTVVVPHTQDVYFGFFPITSELPDVEVLHCACVSGGFAVIEVDKSFYPIVQPSLIIGIVKKCTKCLVCERI
ncbi:hypothetical protein T09_4909 [Trichinella sp. T9]|nr:hypothetical protein T09_4909 [Trichinella sp. T9]